MQRKNLDNSNSRCDYTYQAQKFILLFPYVKI